MTAYEMRFSDGSSDLCSSDLALVRLRKMLDLPLLAPIHRLDRDTAGVMLFCVDPDSRGAYQTLFQSRQVAKEYVAVAPLRSDLTLPMVYRRDRKSTRLNSSH